ncbi:DUF5320 domain-containing protein [Candidatus Parcubacteria bacterium]|nr:DUF5320 domain-containing protein [Candidatus Parcubacteria bacterium]
MPGYDKTGPQGTGPMTGRGFGPCGQGMRRCWNSIGRGFGRGRGLFRRSLSDEDIKADLDQEEKILKEELEQVKKEKEALKS